MTVRVRNVRHIDSVLQVVGAARYSITVAEAEDGTMDIIALGEIPTPHALGMLEYAKLRVWDLTETEEG